MSISNFSLRKSQVRKSGKTGSNQSSLYIHPFPSLLPHFFICLSSTQFAKNKLSLRRKKIAGAFDLLLAARKLGLRSYVYVFIFNFVCLISCCQHAYQILPKLPSPPGAACSNPCSVTTPLDNACSRKPLPASELAMLDIPALYFS